MGSSIILIRFRSITKMFAVRRLSLNDSKFNVELFLNFVAYLSVDYIHFISGQSSFHVTIYDAETKTVLFLFWMEEFVNEFNLKTELNLKILECNVLQKHR